jgi:hypothetical protein
MSDPDFWGVTQGPFSLLFSIVLVILLLTQKDISVK